MKKIIALILSLNLIFIFASCEIAESCNHSWKAATCTDPEICEICGKTRGEPLGHSWEDATCYSPKTCKVCGAVEGDVLDHVYVNTVCVYCGRNERSLSEFGFYDLNIENRFVLISSYNLTEGFVLSDDDSEYNIYTLHDGYFESYHNYVTTGNEETNKIMYSIESEDSIVITANGTVEKIYDRVIIDESSKAFILKLILPSGSERWWLSYNSVDWKKAPEKTEKGVKLYLNNFD